MSLCQCGCGQPAPIMPHSNRGSGRVKGQPYRFIRGHNLSGGPVEKRFAASYEVDPATGCWLWQLSLNRDGYATIRLDGGRRKRAHRFSYELHVAPIPPGMHLDHLCRVRNCVNPDHLEAVTPRENALRGETVPAANAAKTHCIRSHEFTPENTVVVRGRSGRPERQCRECANERKRQRRRRNAA